MKETIEQAAKQYALSLAKMDFENGASEQETRSTTPIAVNSFRVGAEWQAKQSPWKSAEEQLPEENLINPSAWSVTYKVFVLTSNGNASISQRRWNSNTNRWEWKGSGSFKDSITHWMPIPSLSNHE